MSDLLFPTDTTWVTPATWDIILIADVSDSNNPKDCTLAELPISTATQTALNSKQDTLVSWTNIKTINSTSILWSGDIVISGGGSVATDTIWDAKWDLAGGTGANTASRLAVGTNWQVLTADSAEVTGLKWANPAGGWDALTSGTLAQFAVTTSAQLATVISDETGSWSLVFANSPTLVTPALWVATATSINGASIISWTLDWSATGTNTGDQTSIVGITGTKAQFDTACTDGNFLYSGDIISSSTTAQGIVELATTAEINTGTDSTRAMPIDQFVDSNRNVRYFDIYAIEKATDNAVGTNIIGAIECPFTWTITEIGAYVETAWVTGASVWDVNKNGTTIMTTNKLSIDSAEVSTRTAATAPTLTTTAITAGDLITIDTDSLSTTKPKWLHIRIWIRQS